MKKKHYIIPLISFEQIEETSSVCITGSAPDQPWGECAKAASPTVWENETFADPFAEEVEEATSDFVFNNDLNW